MRHHRITAALLIGLAWQSAAAESWSDLPKLCAAPFQFITDVVVAHCSNWAEDADDKRLTRQAANILISAGIIRPNELDGVEVRWCPLQGANGMAPDRGRIYLHVQTKGDVFSTATTLAHEVMHLRQYERLGGDIFKCAYSIQYAECGGRQDRCISFEREAYDFEESIQPALNEAVRRAQTAALHPK